MTAYESSLSEQLIRPLQWLFIKKFQGFPAPTSQKKEGPTNKKRKGQKSKSNISFDHFPIFIDIFRPAIEPQIMTTATMMWIMMTIMTTR